MSDKPIPYQPFFKLRINLRPAVAHLHKNFISVSYRSLGKEVFEFVLRHLKIQRIFCSQRRQRKSIPLDNQKRSN